MDAYFCFLLQSVVRSCLIYKLGKFNRSTQSVVLSEAFAVFPQAFTEFRAETSLPCLWNSKLRYPPPPPHTPSEFQSKKPPLSLRIPRCHPWYGMDIFWNHPILQSLCINFTIDVYHLCLLLSLLKSIKDITILEEVL